MFVYDSKPMTYNDYLNMVRERGGEVIGVMKPYTNKLQFYLYNKGKTNNLYKNEARRFLLMNKLMKLGYRFIK